MRAFNFASFLATDQPAGPLLAPNASARTQHAMTRVTPLLKPLVQRDYDARDPDRHRARIVAAMDRLEAELQGRDYLVGHAFSVADLTAATLFTPVLDPPGREHMPAPLPAPALELRGELSARPGGAWVHEIFAKHR